LYAQNEFVKAAELRTAVQVLIREEHRPDTLVSVLEKNRKEKTPELQAEA